MAVAAGHCLQVSRGMRQSPCRKVAAMVTQLQIQGTMSNTISK